MSVQFPRKVASLSKYAKRMDRLSKRIFVENHRKLDVKTQLVPRFMSEEPWDQYFRFSVKYYPPLPMFHYLMKLLRMHGLFRDEHLDFNEEMERLRTLRGKGRPIKGQGKRAQLRQQNA